MKPGENGDLMAYEDLAGTQRRPQYTICNEDEQRFPAPVWSIILVIIRRQLGACSDIIIPV
jgi:hypothetical protein